MHEWITSLLTTFSLPEYGLSAVFVMSFISATLVPIGAEPIMFGLLKVSPELFWPTILIATLGNTLGGAFGWWTGHVPHKLRDIGVSETHLDELADLAIADFAHPNNPKPVTRNDFRKLYQEAL